MVSVGSHALGKRSPDHKCGPTVMTMAKLGLIIDHPRDNSYNMIFRVLFMSQGAKVLD
jgi:hypothetical protein